MESGAAEETPADRVSGSGAEPAVTAPLDTAVCVSRLDVTVSTLQRTLARSPSRTAARSARDALRELADRCEHLPQIHHDLGVLAAREQRLPEAFGHFERALALDPRAGATLEALRGLHRREAALAYARALGTPAATPMPRLTLQDSSDVGVDTLRARAARDPAFRQVATLEYELYAWWQSAGDGARVRRSHYVDGYPRAAALADRARDATIPWENVRRDIDFTAEDAVAVIEQPGTSDATDPVRRLLLLRLEGARWKIYRETPL